MTTVVIPFAGADGKSRLHESRRVRRTVSLAMLGDVLAACVPIGHARGLGIDAVSVVIPNLSDDVDTMDDLSRLHLRLGPRSQAALAELS